MARAVERHEADVDLRRDDVEEDLGRLLGRVDPVGGDVGGHHRQRRVDGQDHRRPLARDLLLAGRAGQGHHHARQAEHEGDGGEVAAPPGRLRGDAASRSRLVNRTAYVAAAHLERDVGDRQREHDEQQPQPARCEVGEGDHVTTCPARPQMRSRRRGDEADEVEQPVAVGAQLEVVGARRPGCRRRSRPAARRRPRRSARGAAGSTVWISTRSPVRGSTSSSTPTAGSSSSRGSTTSTQRISWRAASWRERLVPRRRRRGSRTRRRPGPGAGTTRRGGGCRRRRRSCPARDAGAVRMRWSRAIRWSLPPRAGTVTGPSGASSTAPMRLPVRAVRNPTAAAAEMARSRFSHSAVPKSRPATGRARSHVSSSRSAIVSRTWGCWSRAVTFQSMRRTSSPGWYCAGLAELGAVAGHEAEVLAVEQPVEAPADQQVEAAQDLLAGCPTSTSAWSAAWRDTAGSGAAVVGAIVRRRGREAQVLSRRSRECPAGGGGGVAVGGGGGEGRDGSRRTG